MVIGVKIFANDGRVQINATGGETSLAFDFAISDEDHIKIIRTRSGVDATLAITTDYTVPLASINDEDGGTITLVSPALSGDRYTLLLNVPYERVTDFSQAGDFLADALNLQLDLLTQQNQQIVRDLGRSAKLPESSTITSLDLPTPEASALIGWNSAADELQNYAGSATSVPVSTFMATVLDDASASEARTTLGAGDMNKATYDPANISQQVVGTTATQTLSNKILQDSTTLIVDSADATKAVRFECSGIATGNTRVLAVPNADGTLATLDGTETLSNKTLVAPALGVASATSINFGQDALNYYDEGTFTPRWTGLTVVGTPTYTANYTRIGRMVFCEILIVSTVSTASTAGTTFISGGLPFAIGGNSTCAAVNAVTRASYGIGFVRSSGSAVDTPAWPASAQVVLSFSYLV